MVDSKARVPVVLAGATGKTGACVGRAVTAQPDLQLVGALSRRHPGRSLATLWSDASVGVVLQASLAPLNFPYAVLVDFTEPESALPRLLEAAERGWDLVVGTTGFSPRDLDQLAETVRAHQVGAAVIANFSVGSWVAQRLAREASRFFDAVEVVESHHPEKRDRPSGTAQAMARVLGEQLQRPPDTIPVHSLRLPGMVAHQAVVFGAPGQVLTIRHDVHDRNAYVDGVLAAIRHVHQWSGRVVSDLGAVLDPRSPPDGW